MKKTDKQPKTFFPSEKMLLRIGIVLIIALAIIAGLYGELYRLEKKRYARVEDLFVRVRSQLGREETQRLIDRSYVE
ncbi:hypothetical protein KC921_01575 [Candidatus Woesebacteria bacterium]|nr:hypothetical protein [Candidatus Woesebacteria bacterium]